MIRYGAKLNNQSYIRSVKLILVKTLYQTAIKQEISPLYRIRRLLIFVIGNGLGSEMVVTSGVVVRLQKYLKFSN